MKPLRKRVAELVAEAETEIETLTAEEALALHGQPGVTFVDIRDIRELDKEGRVPGAVHAPRGMLEFWVDPDSPYHREVFARDDRYVLFCAKGQRSALATQQLQRMGFGPICHVGGGFAAWREGEGPIEK
nr:rhodanese-like domain-containing protein [uncultured Halomonas sp.]